MDLQWQKQEAQVNWMRNARFNAPIILSMAANIMTSQMHTLRVINVSGTSRGHNNTVNYLINKILGYFFISSTNKDIEICHIQKIEYYRCDKI